MKVILANPRGFCAGVDRAIEIVEKALENFGAPIYVRHEVVHNKYVVDELRNKGAIFVEDIEEIPEGSTAIFSAHGVAQQVRVDAEKRHLKVFDATCPLVTKVHIEVARHSNEGQEVVLVGHAGHPEVEGTLGQYNNPEGGIYLVGEPKEVGNLEVNNPDNLFYVTQTTLSIDDTQSIVEALKIRFPNIQGPKKDDICYATQNRQNAVNELVKDCDLVLVVGSANSSNSNRLREIAAKRNIEAYLIDGAQWLQPEWLAGKKSIGVTAGASAPEILVQQVIQKLAEHGFDLAEESSGIEENVVFNIPAELRVS
ncbi:MAG: 4-hydroxy-3-methylbut-2-enyl diphosphate reductase [Gammaproteobacteria bacterium]|nr:4-hydroxy-3-methylbut-2-enyl diphosphate reductase [Gammaproteobacteria bacterium]